MLKLVIGLGNPGPKYEKTRHNAGFLFLDELLLRYGGEWRLEARFQGMVGECVVSGHKLILLKPQTFMNLSGDSVGKVVRYYRFQVNELLIVHDELDLSDGVVRLKHDGGHAGHNGLRSVVASLGARDFYRLRIGIGRPVAGSVSDYVLSRFSNDAWLQLFDVMSYVCDEFSSLIEADVAAFNGKLPRFFKK